MKKYRGFTLIELLVVIAIIGILSAVVLASLNTARSKGNDAGIKANLDTVGTQAALFLSDNNNSYGAFDNGGASATCPTEGTLGSAVFHNSTIEKAIASALVDSLGGATFCFSTDTAYAVAVSRPADVTAATSAYWCVDSSGTHCGINSTVLKDSNSNPSCGTCASTQ